MDDAVRIQKNGELLSEGDVLNQVTSQFHLMDSIEINDSRQVPGNQLGSDTIMIAGYPVSTLNMNETAELICLHGRRDRLMSPRPYVHTSINGQVVYIAERDRRLKDFLQSADVVSCDSQPIVMFSKFGATRSIGQRAATTDLIHVVAQLAETQGVSFFLLGGTESENYKASQKLYKLYPRLKIVGRHHGYFHEDDEQLIYREINRACPDILWLAMGVPREQEFAERCALHLSAVGVIKTCGGCFKILSGEIARPWKIFQIMGLEWVARMFLEPKHVILRYLVSTPIAIWLAIKRMDRR